MGDQVVEEWAAETATHYLVSLGDRWLHVQGVVKVARHIGCILSSSEHGLLIAAAYLHDIGYAPDLRLTGFHPLDGAQFVESQGYYRLACLIAHHSGARFEAKLRGLHKELHHFPLEQSALLAALNYCDMMVGPSGQFVDLPGRFLDVQQRYGLNHIVSCAFRRALPSLKVDVSQTKRRLMAHGIAQENVALLLRRQ
jgi:hypothetical protein